MNSDVANITYRPELDGLRAIAVLGVLLYHGKFGLTGGYTGVDVFFVISGYLITRLIHKDLDAHRFSLPRFWERRVRRIFPALAVLMFGVLAAGYLILLPPDLIALCKSALAQIVFASNVYFWRDSGYFAGAAELKPLLHTWSLAIEEQFYLLFPWCLPAIHRWPAMYRVSLLSCLLAVSFAAGVYGTWYHPAATFYLLPTRAWELLAGSVLAMWPYSGIQSMVVREILSSLGLAGIAAAMWWFDASTLFPGAAALLPVAGTVAVIASNATTLTRSGKLLAWKPLVRIGLISYSLYLWHWPLLSLAHYVGGANYEWLVVRLAAVGLSFLFAFLSYRFVERPIRQRRVVTTRYRVAALFFAGSLLLAALGSIPLVMDGLPRRFPPRILQLADAQKNASFPSPSDADIREDRVPVLGDVSQPVTWLLWGDSHALVLRKTLDELGQAHRVAIASVAREATPIVDSASESRNAEILAYIRRHRIRNVLLAARWSSMYDQLLQQRPYLLPASERQYRIAVLKTLLDELAQMGCSVWILLEVPCQPGGDAYQTQLVLSQAWPMLCRIERSTREQHESATQISRRVIAEASQGRAHILDPATTCFDSDHHSIVMRAGEPLYLDDDHLSDAGVRVLLRPLLEPLLESRSERAFTAEP